MGFNMMQEFPAVLKTLEGKILEYGTGSISEENQSLDFKGGFVPICKMGTQLEVVRVQGDIETQRFVGEVYLSSQRMLRLISLSDEVLPGAASAYSYNVSIPGHASANFAPEAPKRLGLLHRHSEASPAIQTFPIKIHALSMSQMKFTCDLALSQGQRVTVYTDHPIHLDELAVEVELPITLGPEKTCSYRCRILELSGNNYFLMEAFTRELSLRENKLFPPAFISSEEEHS